MPSYLEQLTLRLAAAVASLPAETRARHAHFTWVAQQSDGGFAGRQGGSDLYYTGFALRSLAVLGELHGPRAQAAANFLSSRLAGRETIVDFLSLVYGAALLETSAGLNVFQNAAGDWRSAVAEALERLRRPDGGYAKGPEGQASSTYHTFLVLLCRELIGRPPPEPDRIAGFVLAQRDETGGFREIRAQKRGGTNPTAAALGSLRVLARTDLANLPETIDFLAEMQTDEGGLRANTRIPIADLLSTFTGVVTLIDLQAAHAINLSAAQRFVASLQRLPGGFHGAAWDEGTDVEYTFYGLGAMALLAAAASD